MLRKASDEHIYHKKISKPRLFFNFFINQTSLVNIYAENTVNLQNRAGRYFFFFFFFFGGVQLVGREISFQKHISQHLQPS